MQLVYSNVNQAFEQLTRMIETGAIKTRLGNSRVGHVMVIDEPTTITYNNPRERVLFNVARDCNPFFHLFESLWMLAGRNDVAPLAHFNSKIADIASDDGKTFNGAYGYRWRAGVYSRPLGLEIRADQLNECINQLRSDSKSRRVVLQMWNPKYDLFNEDTKDKCCNLCVHFLIVNDYLSMTVFNRSNDLILGMLGANVVHFSILQEYVADCVGVKVGNYHQVTNNLHAYTHNWNYDKWEAASLNSPSYQTSTSKPSDRPMVPWYRPLVKNKEKFDQECKLFIDGYNANFSEPFLGEVAKPMMQAFDLHLVRNYSEAMTRIVQVQAHDWRLAGAQWIQRRMRRYESKKHKGLPLVK
jgi:thymidylate synthase